MPARASAAGAQGWRDLGAGQPALAGGTRRIGPLIRGLRRATDPLFRRAGIDLDGEGR